MNHADKDDICLWPDGTWCLFEDLEQMSHMSDDFELLKYGSERWQAFTSG